MDRRTFLKAVAIMAAASLLWDGAVNGGRPACTDDEKEETMNMQVIYGKHDKAGRVSVDHVEIRNLSHHEAVELSKLEGVAAVAAQETMKARMVYVGGKLTQVATA